LTEEGEKLAQQYAKTKPVKLSLKNPFKGMQASQIDRILQKHEYHLNPPSDEFINQLLDSGLLSDPSIFRWTDEDQAFWDSIDPEFLAHWQQNQELANRFISTNSRDSRGIEPLTPEEQNQFRRLLCPHKNNFQVEGEIPGAGELDLGGGTHFAYLEQNKDLLDLCRQARQESLRKRKEQEEEQEEEPFRQLIENIGPDAKELESGSLPEQFRQLIENGLNAKELQVKETEVSLPPDVTKRIIDSLPPDAKKRIVDSDSDSLPLDFQLIQFSSEPPIELIRVNSKPPVELMRVNSDIFPLGAKELQVDSDSLPPDVEELEVDSLRARKTQDAEDAEDIEMAAKELWQEFLRKREQSI